MKQPMDFTGSYPSNWAGYVFKEALGYTSGVHTGVDYNWGSGSQDLGFTVVAITAGTVVARINDGQVSGFGNALIIESDCPPGTAGTKMYHRYLHLSAIHVSVGQTVGEGQHIANVGGTGGVVPHLHLDVWTNRNGLGVHWNYDKNTALSSYEDPYHLIANNSNWTSGGSMAETINDDTARQLGYYKGRNGYDGRPYALSAPQPDIQGRPLTNAEMSVEFLSAESRQWRDVDLPNLYAERDSLRAQVGQLNNTITTLNQQVTDLSNQVASQQTTITDQQQTINGQKVEIGELQDENAQLKKQVKDLEAQLATSGDTTINFNFVGVFLWAIIKSFGLKKEG